MNVWIYDFEVTTHDWLVVFKRVGVNEVEIIANDREALIEFYEEFSGDIFAGFNTKYYDVWIFRAIMSGMDPWHVTQLLIEERVSGYRIPGIGRQRILTYDLSQDIQGAPFLSLKEAEANLGLSIVESTIPFDIGRKLTATELTELEDYCVEDVLASDKLFHVRYDDFKASVLLIQKFDLGIDSIDKTTAQLTAKILGASKGRPRYDELEYDLPEEVQIADQEVLELYVNGPLDYKKQKNVTIAGVPHRLAYGGLHGARKKYHKRAKMVLLDVSSYYPSLMIKFGFMSRNAKYPERFTEIFNKRLEYKVIGHEMSYPYKIAIAATFGCMKNKYNDMYDPKQPNQICITGQLLLVDLIEKLEPYSELIQSNTDGVLIEPHPLHMEYIEEVVAEWESRTGMSLEWDWGTGIWQKDVNNYIYLHENGDITVKGGYVKGYNGKYTGSYSGNTAGVIDKAVVEYIVHGVDPAETVYNEKELIRFQYVAKAGMTFDGGIVHMVNGMELPVQKVNRVFASLKPGDGALFKVKQGKNHKIPNIPNNCFVYNKSIANLSTDGFPQLDYSWYIEEAWKRIVEYGVERID